MRSMIAMGFFVLVLIPHRVLASPDDSERLSWLGRQKVESLNRCGANCLQLCCEFLGRSTGRTDINTLVPPTGEESTLLTLRQAAEKLDLWTLSMRWHALPALIAAPMIVRIGSGNGDERHFVVLLERRDDEILVCDVPHSPIWVSVEEFQQKANWDGVALCISDRFSAVSLLWLYAYWFKLLSVALLCLLLYFAYRQSRKASILEPSPQHVGEMQTTT